MDFLNQKESSILSCTTLASLARGLMNWNEWGIMGMQAQRETNGVMSGSYYL